MGLFRIWRNRAEGDNGQASDVTLGDGKTYAVKQIVNCIGLDFPRPQFLTQKALANATIGDVIEVHVDSPLSMEAIPYMAAELRGIHLDTLEEDFYWRVFIRRS